jgi:hypothetical protein
MKNPDNTLIFHETGFLSYRINSKWTREVRQITQEAYKALPREFTERIVYEEYNRNRSLVEGTRVIVGRH